MRRSARTQEVLDRGYEEMGLEGITQIVEIEQMLAGSMPCYDREGVSCTVLEHLLLQHDASYRHVASTEVAGCTVSTVWLGQDHSFGRGELQIFETLVLAGAGAEIVWEGIECERYATEAEAVAGHELAVAALRATLAAHREEIAALEE